MSNEREAIVLKQMMLVLVVIAVIVLGGLGLAMYRSNLGTEMFCCCKDGFIWTARGARLLPDTPENRRRVSRWFGLFFIVLPCVALAALLIFLHIDPAA